MLYKVVYMDYQVILITQKQVTITHVLQVRNCVSRFGLLTNVTQLVKWQGQGSNSASDSKAHCLWPCSNFWLLVHDVRPRRNFCFNLAVAPERRSSRH